MEWLNYHHLLYFWLAAKTGSVTQASDELRLSQSTVSAQIGALERAKAAEELLRDATSPHRGLLARLEALKEEIARCERGLRGWT